MERVHWFASRRIAWLFIHAALALIALAVGGNARAQASFPSRDLQIVVPNEPGGGLDLLARRIAQSLSSTLGRSVIVVNRSGASGNIGTASVARSEPDGHTLLLTGVGLLVSPLLHSQPGYDPLKDLVPVIKVAEAPSVLVVHQSVKHLGLKGLLEGSGKLAYASAGHGQSSHVAAELLQSRAGVRWLHVPFKGTAPASRALLSGDVQLMFVPAGSVKALLANGAAHALAVAHPRRLAFLPETPTLAELGVSGADFSQWYGILVPSGTPDRVVTQLNDALSKVVSNSDFQDYLRAQGIEPALMNRTEFSEFVRDQSARLSALAKRISVERVSD